MYIKKIVCENLGPIARLTIDFPFEADGKPQLVALVGQNGAGKSLVLSTLLDAFIEIKRQTYTSLPEVPKDEFIRLQKKDYIRSRQDHSYVAVSVSEGETIATLTELVRGIPQAEFQAKYPAAQFPHLQQDQQHFQESGFFKHCAVPNPIQDAIKKNVALYFPYFRYESPAWLNPNAAPNLVMQQDMMYGRSTENLIKTNIVHEIENWILDLVLDMELYERRLIDVPNLPPIPQLTARPKLFIGYEGPNARTSDQLNQLLTSIYKGQDNDIESARIGVSRKVGRRVSVIVKRTGDDAEEMLGPTFSHLSSGQLMAFSIGATILREYDQLNGGPAQSLPEIRGVVLIDEADLHLHIQLQRTVLPALFRLFPNVQFIVTTHSPFFLLGLSQSHDIPHAIFRLPLGERIAAEDFVEFQHAYDTFVEREKQFKVAYDAVSMKLRAIERPLVITEGQTDWQHMKAALVRLRANSDFLDLDFDFHEYRNVDMGSATLRSMCEQFSKVPHTRRVIFVFDRDDANIIALMEDPATGFKACGNNVYSFCIPVPAHRANYEKITIESYYSDAALRTADPTTGYRLVFSNEIRKHVETSLTHKGDTTVTVRLLDAPNADEEYQKFVYDQDCEYIVNAQDQRVAHSKTVFAQKVLLRQVPFDNFDAAPFSLIFDHLRQVLNA